MPKEGHVAPEEFRRGILEEIRPWGRFRRYPKDQVEGIKILTLEPGGVLSLQYHKRRSEYWVVLDEGLEVTLGERVWRPEPGEEIWIPCGVLHRASGVGRSPARFLEFWFGDPDERDIVRVEDVYNRG
ncbi:MAG: phosphomannose isomerase type II C-terminal cupin domain [Acidobacteriota bacterium]